MFKILFQGDSLTDACRDKECKDVDTNKRLGVGYVNHVAAYLMSVNPEIRVKNNGVNGNRIVDLYARWTEDTLNEEFDLLSILCGVNDVGFQLRLNRGVETEKYRYIYDRMLYEVRERRPEAKIVLCEPFLFRLRPEEVSYGTDIIENWDTWYGEICRRAEVVDEMALVFFASDAPVSGFDCDRDMFVGSYRSEENPIGVERGELSGSSMYGGDPCFALQLDVQLKAGEKKKIRVFLGTAMTEDEIRAAVSRCREEGFAEKSFLALQTEWKNYFSAFQCSVPDADARRMINTWNPYQVERNFQFSRNISYYATGTFRGVGMRDTAQDVLAMIPLDPQRAKEKMRLLFTQQYKDGHCNHYFFPIEGWDPVTRIHSDNHLWLVLDVYQLAMEEGTLDFLDEVLPYYDGGEGTVWEHVNRSVDFTASHMGEHGFPLMLSSDWNDMLYKVCRKGKGESIWTAMQFGTALTMMRELAELRGEDGAKFAELYERQRELVNGCGWDGAWFRRCITDEGVFIGSASEPQAKIWLNTQSWAVISGLGDADKQRKAMDSVKELLDTDLGIRKIHPAMQDYPSKEDPLTYYNKGCGENGSVFCHANTWAIIAECMLGRSENAWKYYSQLMPMRAQAKAGAERYRAEPYVYASNIFGPESDRFGLANVSWLTGTAAWMYLAVTQYMLGVRPAWDGLVVKPCLTEEMLPAQVVRRFRGNTYRITIRTNDDVSVERI